jgi:hypothetical protein
MKKIVGIILCLVAVGSAGVYVLMQKKGAAAGQYARYLPQDAVATVSLTHLNSITDTFAATPLGRFLAKDTMQAIMQEMRVKQQDRAEYDQMHDTIAQIMNNPAFRTVFGDDATVALLSPEQQALAKDPVSALRASLVVVAMTPASGALDLFSRLMTSKTVTQETINGLQLTKIVIDPNQTVYGYADEQTVLLAYAPAAITTCMAARKADNSLEKATPFKEAITFWQPYPVNKTYSRFFLNTAKLTELMTASKNPEVKQSGELLQGVASMYSLTFTTDRGLESRARTRYSYNQLHPMVKSAVDSASTSNPSLHLLQEQSLAYSWASSLRVKMIMHSLAPQKQGVQQTDTAVRETFGVSLDELDRAIGPQYGGVLSDIVSTGLFPVPKMTLFLGIRDRKIAETALNGLRRKITGYGLAREEQEVVAGSTIYSWPVLPGDAAQPAMVLTDSMFYLASSKQPLKALLTGKATPTALAAPVVEKLGPELSSRIGRANFGSMVIYPERIAGQTGDMMDWLAGILATTKNISISRLSREWRQLMQSTELIAITTDLTKEQADWIMTLKTVPTPPPGKKAQ